jgi:holo-[acyl-carrier protein] synthase
MIQGIGTDMVEISRMRALIARRGAAAAQRILAPDEMAEYLASHDPARLLAKRFAVKEALAKALGTHDALGKPQLSLSDDLSRLLATRGITHPHVSISDERLYALAFVVLEGPLPPHLSEIT